MAAPIKKIRALLFDKDGTLFDFEATWRVWTRDLLHDLAGGDAERAGAMGAAIGFDWAEGRFLPGSIVVGGTPAEIAAALSPALPGSDPASLRAQMVARAETAPQAEAAPLAPLLDLLAARGLKLGLATNDAEAVARRQLGRAGVTERFDFLSGFDSGFGGKPAPGQILGFAQAMALAPEEIAMIGDSRHDLEAARAAGAVGVGVLTGPADAGMLAPLAEAVLGSIADLPGWLDRRAG